MSVAHGMPPGLAPLARHKDKFTDVQGLSNKLSNEAHQGSTLYLTGANRYSVPGESFSNSISADQVAAEKVGLETRFASPQFDPIQSSNRTHGR